MTGHGATLAGRLPHGIGREEVPHRIWAEAEGEWPTLEAVSLALVALARRGDLAHHEADALQGGQGAAHAVLTQAKRRMLGEGAPIDGEGERDTTGCAPEPAEEHGER